MSSPSLTFAILGLALTSAGCDRQSEAPAQPNARETPDQITGLDKRHAGSPIPDFRFSDPEGKTVALRKLSGKPVLLNLWATWCAPCVTEMPLLDQLAERMEGRLRVITVSQDMSGEAAVAPFFKERGFTRIEPWLDPESELAFYFGGANLPMTVLYDANGREIWRMAGDYDWASEAALRLIEEGISD